MVAKVDVPKKPEVKIKQTLADKKQTRSVLSTKDLKTLAHSSFMNKINELDLSSTELKDRLSKKEMKNALSEIRKQLSANPTVGGVN
jgi:hypothetical protein